MKKIFALLISCALIATSLGFSLQAEASNEEGDVCSQESYGGFELEWTNNGSQDILLSVTGSCGTVSYQYDSEWNRTQKTNVDGVTTYFGYDSDRRLISESRGNHTFAYSYNARGELATITVDGTVYECELDDLSVSKLKDVNGGVVVQYSYSNGLVSNVYGVDENGNLVDRSSDSAFVGNLNHVTYKSYYYDEETGWYYCGRFYDVTGNRFIDGQVGLLQTYLDMLNNPAQQQKMRAARATTVTSLGNDLYSMYRNDSSFGRSVSYKSGWYADMSSLEIASRLIYGESINVINDEHAIAWVVWNRMKNGGFGGTTVMDVSTSGQFYAITGDSSSTTRARGPATSSSAWDVAVRDACYIYAAQYLGGSNSIDGAVTKPIGYTNQLYFCSYNSFSTKVTGTTIPLYHSGLGINITDLGIPGVGSGYTTYQAALNAYTNHNTNIYFNRAR